MANGQKNLVNAIATKLRADTGVGSLVTLTGHDVTDANEYRIGRDMPAKKAMKPYLGIKVFQSVPLSEDGPSHVQTARIHFRCYSTKELTSIQIADRIEHLLHGRTEQAVDGANLGYLDFSDSNISNRQTRWKSRDTQDYDDETEVWTTVVESDVIWVDEACS